MYSRLLASGEALVVTDRASVPSTPQKMIQASITARPSVADCSAPSVDRSGRRWEPRNFVAFDRSARLPFVLLRKLVLLIWTILEGHFAEESREKKSESKSQRMSHARISSIAPSGCQTPKRRREV